MEVSSLETMKGQLTIEQPLSTSTSTTSDTIPVHVLANVYELVLGDLEATHDVSQ